jgi:hypothetical protein
VFSLIITLVAIVLVAALAAAAVYYGGKYQEAAYRAAAGALINQSVQINAAGTMATSQGAAWPAYASGPAFTQPYLNAMPVAPGIAYAGGVPAPAAADWVYYVNDGTTHHFALKNKISRAVCLAVNQSQRFIGIPAAWDGNSIIQCFGPGTPTGTGERAYTYFFRTAHSTPEQDAAALTQSVSEGGPGATPGYPRLCPDDTVITSGVCPGGDGASTTAPSTGGPATPTAPAADAPADIGFDSTITPGKWDIAAAPVGSTASRSFVVTNKGSVGLWVYAWVDSSTNFKQPRGCDNELTPGGSCTLTMAFDAGTTAGDVATQLNIELDAPRDWVIKKFPMTAAVVEVAVAATLSPSDVNFGTVAIGDFGVSTVTVRNTGPTALTVSRAVSGINPYGLGSPTPNASGTEPHTCVDVAPNATCTITAHFAPFTAGAASGTLDVYFQGQAMPQHINVTGVGQDSGAVLHMQYANTGGESFWYTDYPNNDVYATGPDGGNSANWAVVASSAKTITFTLSNTGTKALTYLPNSGYEGFLTGAGPDSNGWTLNSTTCGATLGAGQSCSLTATQTDFRMDYGKPFAMLYSALPGTTMQVSRVFTLCGAGYTFANGRCTANSAGSSVTFYGNWSATIGQSELLLTNNVPASCTGQVGISAQNLCMRDYFQAQLGSSASCSLSYSDAAYDVTTRHPTALKEEFLTCTGVSTSAVANVGGYFPEGYHVN